MELTHLSLTPEQINWLWPQFQEWLKKEKRYMCVDGKHLVEFWYEFMGTVVNGQTPWLP